MAELFVVTSLYDEDLKPLANIPLKRAVLPKQEAIRRIANAIFQKDNVLSLDVDFDEIKYEKRAFYLDLAETALNELLRG